MTSAQWKAELLDAAIAKRFDAAMEAKANSADIGTADGKASLDEPGILPGADSAPVPAADSTETTTALAEDAEPPAGETENVELPPTPERPPEVAAEQWKAEQLSSVADPSAAKDPAGAGKADSEPPLHDADMPEQLAVSEAGSTPSSQDVNTSDSSAVSEADSSTDVIAVAESSEAQGADPQDALPPVGTPDGGTSTESAPEVKPVLDERLSLYHEARIETPAGVAFFAEDEEEIAEEAMWTKPEPGVYTVDIHGGPDTFAIGGDMLDAHDLAQVIRVNERWNQQPVRLISCETGNGDQPIAKELATELGVPVEAPTELAWVNQRTGEPYTTAGYWFNGRIRPIEPYNGTWRVFEVGDEDK